MAIFKKLYAGDPVATSGTRVFRKLITGYPPPEDIPSDCLMFSSPSDFTISLAAGTTTKFWDGVLEYSTDRETWYVWDGLFALNSDNGKLYLRGTGNTIITGTSAYWGSSAGCWLLHGSDISCYGSIENLLDYATVASGNHPQMGDYCYANLFYDGSALISAPELPATTLTIGCYAAMFRACSITAAPRLPATVLTEVCYDAMFTECDSIRGELDLTHVTFADGLVKITENYYPILRFGTALKTIASDKVFDTGGGVYATANIAIRYEFTDNDTPEFNTSYVVSKGGRGSSKTTASYKIYTDNTAIKEGALSQADEYTTVVVYHLNGEVWE